MNTGKFWELGKLSDEALLGDVQALLESDRQLSARLLAHLAEVDERRLHLKGAHPSMFAYCTSLGMSEDEAGRRVCAMRVARRFPVIYEMLDQGTITISVVCRLRQFITPENHEQLLAGVAGSSFRQAEVWLAARFARCDAPSMIRKLPERKVTTGALEFAVAAQPIPPPAIEPRLPPQSVPRDRVQPIAAERFRVQLTASVELKEKLELALDLMSHRNPGRDLSVVLDKALDALIAQLKNERFGETARPRATRASKPDHVTNETKRAVLERDGLGCTFRDANGKVCGARAFLERDHDKPRAKGGGPEAQNVRHLCRAHNQYLAELAYGRGFMERKRAERQEQAQPRAPDEA